MDYMKKKWFNKISCFST